MATYLELHTLFSDSDLQDKVETAIVITAEKIASGNDDIAPFDQTAGAHDNRVVWAAQALRFVNREARSVLKLMLAQNSGTTVSAIQSATDAAIQSNVDSMIDMLATALAAP